jgi:hypothetical protein
VDADATGDNRIDWDSSPAQELVTDGTGDADWGFSGSKENAPAGWSLITKSGGLSPAKSDILAAAWAQEKVLGDSFFYGAFERLDNNGNANIDIELNQNAETFDHDGVAATPEVPKRSPGDVLFTFDQQPNDIRVAMCVWKGDHLGSESPGDDKGWFTLPGAANDPDEKVGGSVDCSPLPADRALGAINKTAAVANLVGGEKAIGAFGDSIPVQNFGEVALNLSKAWTDTGATNPCFSFGQATMYSRSSDSATSEMIDFLEPEAIVPAANCGISVDKKVSATGGTGTFGDDIVADAATTSKLFYEIRVTNTSTDVTLDLDVADVVDPNCTGIAKVTNDATFDAGDTWL